MDGRKEGGCVKGGGCVGFWHKLLHLHSNEMVKLTRRDKPGSYYLLRPESAPPTPAPPTLRLCRIHINLISYRWHPHSILVSSGQIWRLISYFRPNTIKWYWTDVSFHTSVPIQWLMEPSARRRPGETYELGWKGLIVAQGGAKQWISVAHCKKPKHYYRTCIYYIHLLVTILYFHVCSCNFSRTDVADSYSEVI